MDVNHVTPEAPEPQRPKIATIAVQLNAIPALDLNQQQRETWLFSKDIMTQMEQALARLDHVGQRDATRQAVATGVASIPADQHDLRVAHFPGISLESPLPSVCLGKLVSTAPTETPSINKGACGSATDQSNDLVDKHNRADTCDVLTFGKLKWVDCGQEGQAVRPANRVAAPGKATNDGAKPDLPASVRKKRVRYNRMHAHFPDGAGDNAASAAATLLPEGGLGKSAAGGDKSPAKFRGVTQHKHSGRFEAHVWINSLKKQVYLGGYATNALAAEAFDIIQVKLKGTKAKTNFPIENYTEVMKSIKYMDIKEVIASVKREADSFSRGASRFRGLTRAATDSSLWEARISLPPRSRHVYLGLFENEVDAAKAYDRASIRVKGDRATTNFAHMEHPNAIQDYRALQALVDEGCEEAIALSTSDEPEYIRMWESYVKSGMQALRLWRDVFPGDVTASSF